MNINNKYKGVALTAQQWATLDKLAMQTNSVASRGATNGEPSWRAMLRRIADGEIELKTKSPSDD